MAIGKKYGKKYGKKKVREKKYAKKKYGKKKVREKKSTGKKKYGKKYDHDGHYVKNIKYIMYNTIPYFKITLFSRLYVRVGILLTKGNHLHDRIISLVGRIELVY